MDQGRRAPDAGMTPRDPVLTPREVAAIFGVRTTTIARWARAGRLEAVRTPGGHRRYRLSEIRELSAIDPAEPEARRRTGQGPEEERGALLPGPWPIVPSPRKGGDNLTPDPPR